MRLQISPNHKLRDALTKHFWKHGKRVLALTQAPVIDLSDQIPPQELRQRLPRLLRREFIEAYMTDMWVQSGSVTAMDVIRRMERVSKKEGEQLTLWEDRLRAYTRQRSNYFTAKITSIMSTQDIVINNIIDIVISQATDEGWGVDKIGTALKRALNDGLTEMNTYQAERIARTEVGSASMKANWDAMKEMGVAQSKFWVNMEDGKVRPTHQAYMDQADQDIDYEYAPGLKYPNDPDCQDGGEVINCRCDIVWNLEGESGIG
jgi:hypothetical protein